MQSIDSKFVMCSSISSLFHVNALAENALINKVCSFAPALH